MSPGIGVSPRLPGSGDRTERVGSRSTQRTQQMDPEKKSRKVDMKRAWAEARALMWQHRRSLSIGLVLMLVSRVASMILPFSTKYVIDDVLGERQTELLIPIVLAGRRCHDRPGDHVVPAVAGREHHGAARHHEHAHRRRAPRAPPAGLVLRLGQDRAADLAHHDRRRRDPEPGRHRNRAARRRPLLGASWRWASCSTSTGA